ncbi:phage portal protein family protein [Acinetobacter proteolyticus]|uniref:phage portal protein family protein n=1 Tax=Acinetobacter proteolyticus TaxID=1776741 RepID=UPI003D960799
MAKSKKEDKASKKALSGGSLFQQNAVSMLYSLGKQPDIDEVLRKAGISRHRLKILLDDDEIAQAVETRIDALLSTPFRIEPSDTPEAILLMQELKEWFTEVATGAINALFFGYSVQEAVYELKAEGHIGFQWIGEKPMQWFEPKNDGRLIYRPEGNGQEIVVDQKLKFFLTRRKATYEQPYGKALLATLYWLNFFKQNGFKFWAKFLERFGTPILLGKCKDSETNDMNQALLNAHAQSVLSIDAEDDVQVLTAGANGTAGASFETFNNVLIRQIQKVILGQTLTSGTDGTGSRALGQVHENVRKDKLNADVRLVTPTVQATVNALCALNNWPKHEVYLGEKTKQLNTDQADRDVKLKNAGANLTQQYFTREYGLQDGDVAVLTQGQPEQQFKAIRNRRFSFAASVKDLSQEQQELDELADEKMQLFSDATIKDLIANSTSIEDLREKMFALVGDADTTHFNELMDRALFAADILGYVHSKEGR